MEAPHDASAATLASASFASFMPHTAPLWGEGGARIETAANALVTLCSNVLDKPAVLKYRRVPASGNAFTTRIAAVPGALAVLVACGFSRQTYPDGEYWVLHSVDAKLLTAVLSELRVGLQTIERLRDKRASADPPDAAVPLEGAADPPAAAPTWQSLWEEPCVDAPAAEGLQQRRAAESLDGDVPQSAGVGVSADEWSRQLAARSIVHRVAAREKQRRAARQRTSQQTGATICAVLVIVVGLGLGASSFFAVAEEWGEGGGEGE
jgi:hypothetical protein